MDAWILIGMMGAGKSTIGSLLADKTNRKFIDTDKLIEQRLGRPVSQFFKHYGESAFRDHEASVIQSLASGPLVIATGGGAILQAQNFDHLKSIGKVIYLKSDPDELIRRLQKSKVRRPLLNTEDWEAKLKAILESRRELYETADFIVAVDSDDQKNVVTKLLDLLDGDH